MLGSLGDFGCFSFHAVKNIATGDGGMVTLNDDGWDRKLRELRWLGITKDTFERDTGGRYAWYYDAVDLGYKYQMNDIMAALGLAELEKLPRTNARRAEIVRFYMQELAGVGDIRLPAPPPVRRVRPPQLRHPHRPARRPQRVPQGTRHLHRRPLLPEPPLRDVPAYHRELPVTERVWKQVLTLPLFPDLTDGQAATVTGSIRESSRPTLRRLPRRRILSSREPEEQPQQRLNATRARSS